LYREGKIAKRFTDVLSNEEEKVVAVPSTRGTKRKGLGPCLLFFPEKGGDADKVVAGQQAYQGKAASI